MLKLHEKSSRPYRNIPFPLMWSKEYIISSLAILYHGRYQQYVLCCKPSVYIHAYDFKPITISKIRLYICLGCYMHLRRHIKLRHCRAGLWAIQPLFGIKFMCEFRFLLGEPVWSSSESEGSYVFTICKAMYPGSHHVDPRSHKRSMPDTKRIFPTGNRNCGNL